MICPVDDTRLVASACGGYEVHRCPRCQGVSVAGNVLPAVRANAALHLHSRHGQHHQPGHHNELDQPSRVRPCPRDGKMMKPLPYKGIAMDVCPDCHGLWLEAGQLPKLLELVQVAQPVNLDRLADGTEIRSEKLTIDWGGKAEGLWLLGELAGFLFKFWK